jgi:hypothetical protein
LNEYSFRYNHRDDMQPMFVSFLYQISKNDAPTRQLQAVNDPF